MTIATYSELVTEVEQYLNRTDYTVRIPTFIRLVEAKLNRLLNDPSMEVRATITASSQYTPLPSDFNRLIGVFTGNNFELTETSASRITSLDQTNTGGDPREYALVNNALTFFPVNTGAVITILYIRNIPGLSVSNPTNWLLDRAPGLYLFGVLMQAAVFGWNDERVPGIKALFDEALNELMIDSQNRRLGSAPIGPRMGRT